MKRRREKTSVFRKLSMYGFEMVNGGHTFYGLLEFDVTDLRKELRSARSGGTGGSLFSFMLKAIGKCLHEYPEFNHDLVDGAPAAWNLQGWTQCK